MRFDGLWSSEARDSLALRRFRWGLSHLHCRREDTNWPNLPVSSVGLQDSTLMVRGQLTTRVPAYVPKDGLVAQGVKRQSFSITVILAEGVTGRREP